MFRTKLAHRAAAAAASVVALTTTTLVAVTTGGVAHAEAPYTNWRPTTSDWKDGLIASSLPNASGDSRGARYTDQEIKEQVAKAVTISGGEEQPDGTATWTITYNTAYQDGKMVTS